MGQRVSERDRKNIRTQRSRDVNSESVVNGDVREHAIPEDLREHGEIDGFAYGFPCKDFSNVGECKGFDSTYGPSTPTA